MAVFCPECGLQVSDDLKFCRQCGVNLHSTREEMKSRSTKEKFDWSKTWVTDIFLTQEERERRRSVTAEEKRLNEIKSSVITSFVGVGLMIFLRFFFDVVANQKSPGDAEILRSLWMAGIIPFIVGVGIIFNGIFVSRRIVKLKEQQARQAMPISPAPAALPAKTTDQLIPNAAQPAAASVTVDTTAHLPEPVAAPLRRETN